MTAMDTDADRVFKALAAPERRLLLDRLQAENGQTLGQLCSHLDMTRQAVVLVAGDKSGGGEARFYRGFIATADRRFDEHLARQKKGG